MTATVTSPPGLLGVCGGVPSVGTTTSSRPTVTCQELRYQLPLLVLCGSRVELNHHPGKWQTKRSKRFCKIKWRVSVVSCEVVHVLNPRAGGWESPSNTCVWSANEGLRRTDGTSGGFPFECGRQKKRAGKTLRQWGISAKGIQKTCRLGTDQKNYSLGPAALIGLHVRNCWFSGRAYLCGHFRRVAPDEGDRLDMDESRQVEKRQMDAAEGMNSLQAGETASSPPLTRARLVKPPRRRTGENWEGRNRTDQSRRRGRDEEPRVLNREFYFGQMSARSRDIISSTARGKCSLVPRSGTCSTGRARRQS